MDGMAKQGDIHEGICGHGADCCPHSVTGTISSGSGDVYINGSPAARLNDDVIHNCPHCGTGYVSSASGKVIINGRGAARIGDKVTYPGGSGVITTASGNVAADNV